MCRKKRDRFIPCRGGGTGTTYYTDIHDADEDLRTITAQGGRDHEGSGAGIAFRDMYNSPSNLYDVVASRLIYLS
jgi:hypothetical protein